MRRLGPALLALLLVVSGTEARSDEATAAPGSLAELGRLLDRLADRLAALVDLARKDPRFRDVEAYRNYRLADFQDPRRPVKARKLLDIMADPDAPPRLRREAQEALMQPLAKGNDPDLLREDGRRKPRNEFCLRHVVEHLRSEDRLARELTQGLLLDFFGNQEDPAISLFRPETENKTQWRRAYDAWRRVLRK